MALSGNDIGIYVEGQLIGCLTNATFSTNQIEIDVTCKDNNGDRAILSGGEESEFTFEGYFDPAATYGFQDLVALNKNVTRVLIEMIGDDVTISAYCYLNQIEWNGQLNSGSIFSGTFTVDGEYTDGSISSSWILATSDWVDSGLWIDSELWID